MLRAVRGALARVLERDPETVTVSTELVEAGADSVALVEIADLVEAVTAVLVVVPAVPGP